MARPRFFKELDYYSMLNVPRDATLEMINDANKKLLKYFHPDQHKNNPFATSFFQNVREAHDTLSDSDKRRMYDMFLEKTASEDSERISNFSTMHLCEEATLEQLERVFSRLEAFLVKGH